MNNEIFKQTFYNSEDMPDVKPGTREFYVQLKKFIAGKIYSDNGLTLPSLQMPQQFTEKLHDALFSIAPTDPEDGEILKAVLTALSLWGNEKTGEILEESLLSLPETTLNYEILVWYYIIALAHNGRHSSDLEAFIARVFNKIKNQDRNADIAALKQAILYYVSRHPSDQLMELAENLYISLYRKDHTVGKQALLSIAYNCHEDQLIPFLEKNVDPCNEETQGVLFFAGIVRPKISVMCRDFIRPQEKSTLNSITESYCEYCKDCVKEMKHILERTYQSCRDYRDLFRLSAHELQKHMRENKSHKKALDLWQLLVPGKFDDSLADDSLPKLAEIKLFREILALDSEFFKRALLAVNTLASAVVLIESHKEYEGIDALIQQNEVLAGKKKIEIDEIYEIDMWQSPVENASQKIMDMVSDAIRDKQFPEEFFSVLRVMLTVRHNWPGKTEGICEFGDPVSGDLMYFKPEEIYPLVVEILRRELLPWVSKRQLDNN